MFRQLLCRCNQPVLQIHKELKPRPAVRTNPINRGMWSGGNLDMCTIFKCHAIKSRLGNLTSLTLDRRNANARKFILEWQDHHIAAADSTRTTHVRLRKSADCIFARHIPCTMLAVKVSSVGSSSHKRKRTRSRWRRVPNAVRTDKRVHIPRHLPARDDRESYG